MVRAGHGLVFCLALVCLILAGCVGAADAREPRDPPPTVMLELPPTPTAALPTLRVAFTELSGANAVLWLAHAADLFRKHGLAVSLEQRGDITALAALGTDELDVVVGSGMAALQAALDGAEVRIVAGLINTSPYRLMVVPGVESAADLRAIRLGSGRPGSASETAARRALRTLDLELGTDVTLIQIGAAPERLASLENGAVHAAAVVPPDTVLLERLGFQTMVDLLANNVDAPNTQVVVAESMVRTEPGRVQSLVNALIDATALALREPELTKRVLRHYLYTRDEAAIDATYNVFVERLGQRTPYPAERALRQEWVRLLETDRRAERVTPTRLVQRRFVQEAVDSGFVGQVFGAP